MDEVATKTIDDYIGHLGWYNFYIFSVISLVQIPFGLLMVSPVFILADMNYRCLTCFDEILLENSSNIPDQFNVTKYNQNIRNTFFQSEVAKCDLETDACHVVSQVLPGQASYEDLLINDCCNRNLASSDTCHFDKVLEQNYTQSKFVSCSDYYFYSDQYESTAKSEFNLVCENSWLADLASSIFYVGTGVGGVIAGILTTKFGRKKILILASILGFIATAAASFSPNVYVFIVLRFLMGFSCQSMVVAGYTLGMECIGSKNRAFMSLYHQIFNAAGECLISLLVLFLKSWRNLQFVMAMFSLPGLILRFWENLQFQKQVSSKLKICLKCKKPFHFKFYHT